VHYRRGVAEAGMEALTEAERRFEQLAVTGDTDAERMAAVAMTQRANCLRDLGRFDEAVTLYEALIVVGEKRGFKRSIAVDKGQLGAVHLRQKRYSEAIALYAEAKSVFEELGEPRTVAGSWHQIGMVHQHAGNAVEAEAAYKKSLAISVQHGNRLGEADSLNQLGLLYKSMGLPEESAMFHRKTVDIYAEVQDSSGEAVARNNLACALLKLERYADARREFHRAIEQKVGLGHALEPWTTWDNLHQLERIAGNTAAAEDARQRAIVAYLAYRRDGGESQANTAEFFAALDRPIRQKDTIEGEEIIAQVIAEDVEAQLNILVPKLQAILHGDRNPELAQALALFYMDAVELQLLLESLDS
jgi:tetratricopeptide (TPR) repeat protein